MPRARRTLGWVAVPIGLALATWSSYRLLARLADAGPESQSAQLLLPVLSIAIVVLALALAGVLIRNVVRLVMDRKRGILGSRLRTKLVFFFLALVLPPAVVLFYGSAAVLRMTVEAMLRTPTQDVTQQMQAIVDDWTGFLKDHCLREAKALAADLAQTGALPRNEVTALLERRRQREGLEIVAVYVAGEPWAWSAGPMSQGGGPRGPDLIAAVSRVIPETDRNGTASARIDYLEDGLLAHATAAVPESGAGAWRGTTVATGIYLPRDMTSRMEGIASAGEAYRQLRVQRRELIRLYLSLISLIFLVTVFVATWMGFYLSRRITEPVEELVRATREISAGNLQVRVGADVGDEVGGLVREFNEMAAQLQESREMVGRSTADLRRSNLALDERRRYIETLVESLSTAIISLDPQGRVTTANPATERILGIRPGPGTEPSGWLARPGLELLRELVEPAVVGGVGGLRRDLLLARDGAPITVSAQVRPLRGGAAEPIGTLIMVEDTTDLLRAQRTAAWQEVARRIAHEIKNPLTPIQLAAQRLRKKFEENAADLGQILPEATASIEREVAALKRLVDEFSKFARMPETLPEPVEFTDVIRSVQALYQGLSGIRWEVETPADVGTVRVDPEQMRRVLINLIDNAVAAMNGKGTIRIAAGAHAGPGSLHIEVSDTGPGIPPGDRDKMFAPYFSTKRRGTGLGLAIVHRVVTDHRGTIRVEDNEPHGARFVIEIPA